MMKDSIIDSFGRIDDDMIASVDALRQKKRRLSAPVRWAAAAACLCLIVFGTVLWQKAAKPALTNGDAGLSGGGVTIPKREVSLSADGEADMIGFFIYHGSCYVQYEWMDSADIVGEYLGTATGLIDEWTPKDGYVELAGSVRGDFFAAKGYDPAFMLCMKDASGAVSTYICNSGITLRAGSELYEDRLHLSDRYVAVQYESRQSWYYSMNEVYQIDEAGPEITGFIEQLDKAGFMLWKSVPAKEGLTDSSIYDTEIFHVYFKMDDGTTVRLRLYENGYVRFQGLLDVCVQVPEECFGSLIYTLENHVGAHPVSVPSRTEIKFEKCRSDPELGSFIPAYELPGSTLIFAEVYYYLEPYTGVETGSKEICLEYADESDPNRYYSVTITWRDEYGRNGSAGPMLDKSGLSDDALAEFTDVKSNGVTKINVGVWFEDVSVVLSASGMDTESAFLILDSVR